MNYVAAAVRPKMEVAQDGMESGELQEVDPWI